MMQADMSRAGRELDVRTTRPRCRRTFASAVAGESVTKVIPRPQTDSYFGVVSSAQEAHAILEASKLGVSSRFCSLSCHRLVAHSGLAFISFSPESLDDLPTKSECLLLYREVNPGRTYESVQPGARGSSEPAQSLSGRKRKPESGDGQTISNGVVRACLCRFLSLASY